MLQIAPYFETIWNHQLSYKYETSDNPARWHFVQTYGWCLISCVANIGVIWQTRHHFCHLGKHLAGIQFCNCQLFLEPLDPLETLKKCGLENNVCLQRKDSTGITSGGACCSPFVKGSLRDLCPPATAADGITGEYFLQLGRGEIYCQDKLWN